MVVSFNIYRHKKDIKQSVLLLKGVYQKRIINYDAENESHHKYSRDDIALYGNNTDEITFSQFIMTDRRGMENN